MKREYTSVELEVVTFNVEDVISTSCNPETDEF